MLSLGIIAALVAFVGWGFGDFLIQKGTRSIGSVETLFFIGLAALIGLFPLVSSELLRLSVGDWMTLLVVGTAILAASYMDFEALRQGKMAIIEPIVGLELPLTVVFAITIGHEVLGTTELLLSGLVFAGVILSVTTRLDHLHYHKRLFEKGVLIALAAAFGLALVNFLVGESSRELSALTTVWFGHSFLALACGIQMLFTGRWKLLGRHIKKHPFTILGFSVFDNIAWAAYALSMTLIPISIATTISGSYIALAVLLGLFVARERVASHQVLGIGLVIAGVAALSYLFA